MTKIITVKTTRAKYGTASLKLSRFPNYSEKKWNYSCSFYNTTKFFDTYKELRDYVEANYEMVTWEGKEYHMPESRQEFFN